MQITGGGLPKGVVTKTKNKENKNKSKDTRIPVAKQERYTESRESKWRLFNIPTLTRVHPKHAQDVPEG